ncbi:ATP-binding cassette domain-containing protein [Aurantiacibacter sediminis]|uniref:ATP-binding cassette domain-containing protein n=1 Tax=Aurantiacibacter sediminis TaxID=2793064 RepID=A0ABS0MZ12_9SPHN|nr:ATP-binding cassette domain-containing protein [Aurantiacibacter sediminis]MBH5320962.1 ATP-binding cassette domain-containing protein [Aurantiacibacter sediminis]
MSFEVEITVQPGEREISGRISSDARLTALVGASGIGKTSVLNAIAGLLRPISGSISVAGRVLFDAERGIDIPPEKRHAGYAFQDARLFPHRRVAANLDYAEKLAKGRKPIIARAEVVRLLDIDGLLVRWPDTLSGGEVRRVAIARALLSAPDFLLLDEPLAALDPERAERLSTLIERLRDRLEIPMMLVSHSERDVARLASKTVRMG